MRAAILRNVQIVYSKKKHLHDMNRELFLEMYRRDLTRVEDGGAVQVRRIGRPFNQHQGNVQRVLGDLELSG